MNSKEFQKYLRWARTLLYVCLISAAGIAVSEPLGWSWFTSYFVLVGVGAVIALVGIGVAITFESGNFGSRHL